MGIVIGPLLKGRCLDLNRSVSRVSVSQSQSVPSLLRGPPTSHDCHHITGNCTVQVEGTMKKEERGKEERGKEGKEGKKERRKEGCTQRFNACFDEIC